MPDDKIIELETTSIRQLDGSYETSSHYVRSDALDNPDLITINVKGERTEVPFSKIPVYNLGFNRPPPEQQRILTIHGQDNVELVTLWGDGRVEYSDAAVNVNEAAKIFWEAVSGHVKSYFGSKP